MGLMVRRDAFGSQKHVSVWEYLRWPDGEVHHHEVEVGSRDDPYGKRWVRISPAEARTLAAILLSVADEYEKGDDDD